MNKEQQRIAIALSQGLTDREWICANGEWCFSSYVPDYLNDLNAIHEAESILTEEQFYIYGSYLDTITLPKKSMPMCYVDSPEAGMYRELICANAAQRAEAFLKTLGLWEDGE